MRMESCVFRLESVIQKAEKGLLPPPVLLPKIDSKHPPEHIGIVSSVPPPSLHQETSTSTLPPPILIPFDKAPPTLKPPIILPPIGSVNGPPPLSS